MILDELVRAVVDIVISVVKIGKYVKERKAGKK